MSNDANALKRKEQIKKILVYGGMVMLCLVSFYFIFKPSKEQVQAEQQKVGFNAELPDPRGAGIEADKIAAYELEDMTGSKECGSVDNCWAFSDGNHIILDWFLGIQSLQILQTGYAFWLWRFNSILLYLFCGRIFVYSGSVLFNTSKIL